MAEQDVWAPSETPIRDEVTLLLDMDPDEPIHCDWCGLFVGYLVPFEDGVPTFCADCEIDWCEEVDDIVSINQDPDQSDGLMPPTFIADSLNTIVVDWEGERTPVHRRDLPQLRGQLQLQIAASIDGGPYLWPQDVDRIDRLFTNIKLGTAPSRCHCRAIMPCKNHPF